MNKRINQHLIYFLIAALFLLAWHMQATVLLNADVAWLIEASKRMLAGGSYTKDFFENNPPWILYFYAPAVLLSKFFTINLAYSLRTYILILAFIALLLSKHFLKTIFSKNQQDSALYPFLLLTLAMLFLIFPVSDFGQREHVLFMLSTPYFLMITQRIQQNNVNPYLAGLTGTIAGSAFILKPYFFAPLLLVESYYLLRKKNILAWIRPEVMAILALSLSYTFLILIRHADYLFIVLPHVIHWCYLGTQRPWWVLINNLWVFWYVLILLFCLINDSRNQQHWPFTAVMLLALSGFLCAYLYQGVDYFYRIFPVAAMELLIVTTLFSVLVITHKKTWKSYLAISIFLVLFFTFFEFYPAVLGYQLILHPHKLFITVFCIFTSLLYLIHSKLYLYSAEVTTPNLITPIKALIFSSLGGCLFFYSTAFFMNWSIFHAFGTVLLMIGIFSLSLSHTLKNRVDTFILTSFGMLIFLLQAFEVYTRYENARDYKDNYQPFIRFLATQATHHSVYFFTTELINTSLVMATQNPIDSASRFSGFWLLPGLIKYRYFYPGHTLDQQQIKDMHFFISMIHEDFLLKKPNLVFIDNNKKKFEFFYYTRDDLINNSISFLPFDYLHYFSASQLGPSLQGYRYLTTLKQSLEVAINPLRYQLHLNYLTFPHDHEIRTNIIYLYIQNNTLKMALKDGSGNIQRIPVIANKNYHGKKNLFSIMQRLSSPGSTLSFHERQTLLGLIAQQKLIFPFYNYTVYKRES
ncbi:MAG: hypothetical protein A3E83_01270 [Gammaproteobacteria bacterium RIFCSPHIGHO2_12_FULL_41_20]|nr:MAG: hypothetical protein A3E83_01270 [Gammaproteobacteria bacterium RIFCSPHIGHO2_12_FULL_41_20]